jgi:hypothetical protein
MLLEILPFNSTPVSIPLPPYAANSSGVNVTFLPLPANTQFMASLSTSTGPSLSFVSDIFAVESGTNTACLPPSSASTSSFEIQNTANITQCENFTIIIPPGSTPPLVELFNPRSFSYPLNLTGHSNTTATYDMVAFRQSQVLVSFTSQGGGRNETSPLITVQGDASTPTNCFPDFSTNNSVHNATSKHTSDQVSKGTIIGLSVGLGVTFLLALFLGLLFIIRERLRRKQVVNFDLSRTERQPSFLHIPPVEDKALSLPPPFFGYPGYGEGAVKDPSYVSEKYSPTISDYPRTSISWEYGRRALPNEKEDRTASDPRASTIQMNMLSSSNIENMLNFAARGGRASEDLLHSPRSVLSDESYLPLPPPPAIHHMSLGGRQSPDVPHNPSFSAESTFLIDQSMPLTESPTSMGSLLHPDPSPMSRPDSGANSVSSTGAIDGFEIIQPAQARLVGEPPQRSPSLRTVSRENALEKLEKGSRRTESKGSRFSLDSSDDEITTDRMK